jgi:hypothetical protein
MKRIVIGTCKLCLREGQELRESHLMPAGMYRRLLSDDKNPHPILITKDGSHPSSAQVTDNVLCKDCEARFDRLGENYTLRYAAGSRRFRLLEELEAIKPSSAGRDWRAYKAEDSPSIERDQLGYFGFSVFWRSAVHRWPQASGRERTNKINLGAENTEALRRLLVGERAVPSNMALVFVVLTDKLSHATLYMPTSSSKKDFCWGYGFVACGFMFNLFVGRNLGYQHNAICLMKSPERWIWVRDGAAKTLEALRPLLAKQPAGGQPARLVRERRPADAIKSVLFNLRGGFFLL